MKKTNLHKYLLSAVSLMTGALLALSLTACDKHDTAPEDPIQTGKTVIDGEILVVDKNGKEISRTSYGTTLKGVKEGYVETEKGKIEGLGVYPVEHTVNIKVTGTNPAKYAYKGMYFTSIPAVFVSTHAPFSSYGSAKPYPNPTLSFAVVSGVSYIKVTAVFEDSGVSIGIE